MIRDESPRWSLAMRIAFRFAFCYFALYFLPGFAFARLPRGEVAGQKYFEIWDAIVLRVGEDMLHLPHEFYFEGRGVNNTAYGWVLFLCYLALAAVATVIWSVLDREKVGRNKGAAIP